MVKKYAKRAVILETIAAVPGMVAGMFNHLKSLRRMRDDAGEVENINAPDIAIEYYQLPANAKLRDVALRIREDEAGHRDRNHGFADAYESITLPAHQN